MSSTDLLARYSSFVIGLGVDVAAILLMAYVIYFRRHWRSDLLLSIVAMNVGIYMTMSLLATVRLDVAVGFGLFAILSIVRLRSSAVTQQEVGYYFVALVMGLINGLGAADRLLTVAMNVLLLLTMLCFDSRTLRERSRRLEVHLDKLFLDDVALVAELERRLGGRVMYQEVTEMNFVNKHMVVDVRLRPAVGTVEPQPEDEPRKKGHPAEDAPVADVAGGVPEERPVEVATDGRADGPGRHGVRPERQE